MDTNDTVGTPTLTPYAMSPVPTFQSDLDQDDMVYDKSENVDESINAPLPMVPNAVLNIPNTYMTLLGDNETAELIWNYPPSNSPPIPDNPKSSYRRIGCIPDGSCFFHAIVKAISPMYMYSYKIPGEHELSEKILRQFENTVNEQIHFEDSIFNIPRISNGKYRIEKINDYRFIMDQFRRLYVQLFRKDFARLIIEDSTMKKLVDDNLQGLRSIYEDELLRDYCEVFHLRKILKISGLNMNYKEELAELRNRILVLPTEYQHKIIDAYRATWPSDKNVTHDTVSEVMRNSFSKTEIEECRKIIKPDLVNLISSNMARGEIIDDLLSGRYVPPWYLSVLSDYLNFDMYILQGENLIRGDPRRCPLYGGSELHRYIRGTSSQARRNAIVITSCNDNHYELIGRVDIQPDDTKCFTVTFTQNEPLIAKLYQNLLEIRSKSPDQTIFQN
jgi:hypothetical protein